MAYRSLKRVLGETSLERKCRLLFGCCLLLLVGVAFYWVDSIAENLVIESTRSKGRALVDIVLLKKHFDTWETEKDKRGMLQELIGDLEFKHDYVHEILKLDDSYEILSLTAADSKDRVEVSLLERLKQQLQQRKSEAAEGATPSELLETPGTRVDLDIDEEKEEKPPVFVERVLAGKDQYHYFEAITWKTSCKRCHQPLNQVGAVPVSETGYLLPDDEPFRVVKLIIPYSETRNAINSVRAILIAVAILTVFVAMIALYVIVRYVIVKPLKHLRDVSDEISRGDMELRAELHTADEFEELAASFNRMLRHLTDAQEELQEVNAALDGKVDQLAQLNMRLYEMNRLKGDFLANMSHELRTPLNSIIGFSEVLQGIDSLNEKQKRYAQNIQKSGRVLLEMINDILDLAKMEAGKMEIRPTEFALASVIGAQCDMVRSLTEEKNIDLEVHVSGQLPPVYQDQTKIQQILTNLLSNAIKFTPEGGRITVSGFRDKTGKLVLTVADTGVGIAPEDREIIFEKFRQGPTLAGDNLTREYAGTGLGLSILKELCKLLGGEVSFESEVGIGSTFRVVLPWVVKTESPLNTQLAARLDEMTRPQRTDFRSPPASPAVPAAATEEPSSS